MMVAISEIADLDVVADVKPLKNLPSRNGIELVFS
jgi:hypothetical protein